MDSQMDDAIVSAVDAARRLGVSKAMVYKLFREGKLEGYRVGRLVKIYLRSVIAWPQRYSVGTSDSTPDPKTETTKARKKEP